MSRLTARPHLSAGLFALLIAGAAVACAVAWCERLEERYVHAFAPDFGDEKLQGIALQKEALLQPDLLMLYGSSELLQDSPTHAIHFFSEYPTGFQVFPMGKPGASSLSILQKVAALGEDLQGRKIVYSLSPGFFFVEEVNREYYAGSFSDLQAGELIFGGTLSRELRRDVARRMAEYPETLDSNWLLRCGVEALGSDDWAARCRYTALYPLGRLHNAVGRTQDHFQTALEILERDSLAQTPKPRNRRALNWNDLLRKAARLVNVRQVQAKFAQLATRKLRRGSKEKSFIATVSRADEWTDLELLMRGLRELGAKPLILTMPLEDVRLEALEVSAAAREPLLHRLTGLAKNYEIPLVTFREHERASSFLSDFSDHLSGEGWLYYNKAIDDFFHGKLTSL